MKKIAGIFLIGVIVSCSAGKGEQLPKNDLFQVLKTEEYGGAKIRFYEILSEPDEIKMLESDKQLRNKISTTDVQKSNFVILNMGEKNSGGYEITIDKVEETANNIIISVKESGPEPGAMVTQALTNPFCVVKINSKKEIIFK
jgi:hypothetical protein